MKRLAVAAVVLISALAGTPAFAETDQYDFDLIHRPSNVTDAQVNAGVEVATKVCDPSGQLSYGSKRFLGCMRRQGYKFVRIEHKKSPPADPYFSSNVKLRPGHFIDHDNGLDCKSMGWGDICDPPKGTVHYFDPDQNLPCTRTGAMAICSNM
jgi:hypothetical protein